MHMGTRSALIKAFNEQKKKKTSDRQAGSGQTPYSLAGRAIKAAGNIDRTSKKTKTLEDVRRAKMVPEEDIRGYIRENGLDREDARLLREDPNAFKRQVGNTVAQGTKWQADYLKKKKGSNKK